MLTLGVVQKCRHGGGIKDFVRIVKSLSTKKRDDGGRGCKKYQILRDVTYGRPLSVPCGCCKPLSR
jgi:hypothetical protein